MIPVVFKNNNSVENRGIKILAVKTNRDKKDNSDL
jgi:hypothetical protein